MTLSNVIEIALLLISVGLVIGIVRSSNRKVSDLDGLGKVVKKGDEKGTMVAYF